MGLHTRLDARVEHVTQRARVGNLYVQPEQSLAVVGSQPFGGEGLSARTQGGRPALPAAFLRRARGDDLPQAAVATLN